MRVFSAIAELMYVFA